MSREILFKAKDIDTGEWVEGSLVHYKAGKKHFIITDNDFQWGMYGSYSYDGDFTEIDETTICQYTGLTDKNGNKIWENDVIRYVDEDLVVNGVVRFGRHEQIVMLELGFYVDWVSEGTECFKTDICYWVEKRNIEVIGNIFDNPELVKGSEENG